MERLTAAFLASLWLSGILAIGCDSDTDGISKEDAIAEVLAEVIIPSDDHPMVARIWTTPLSTGDELRGSFDEESRRAPAPEWFVWIDDAPGAFFSHPVRYVFVDRATGSIEVQEASEVPLLNDEPMWDTPEDFANSSYIVFDNLQASPPLGSSPPQRGLGGLARAAAVTSSPMVGRIDLVGPLAAGGPVPASLRVLESASLERLYPEQDAPSDREWCGGRGHKIAILLYNYDDGPLREDIANNVTGMAAALAANGFEVPQFESSTGSGRMQPGIYLGDREGRGLQQLRDFVAAHSGDEHCCDEIFVYYTGHGKETTIRGEKRYYFGLRTEYRGEDGSRPSQKRLYAEDLAEILSGLGSCHIHVVIDSCHSGGFIPALSAVKGVETIRTSAQADELAWGGDFDGANRGRTPDPYGRADGELGSEFTSGFIKGLNERAEANRRTGTEDAPRDTVDEGFTSAVENDIAAIAGKTHPTGWTRVVDDCNCCEIFDGVGAQPPPTPTPVTQPPPTPTEPASAPEPTPMPATSDSAVPEGSVLVFLLDGVFYLPTGLHVEGPDRCTFNHVHGPTITSLTPGSNGEFITRSEHLGACGYGPPNFFIVSDPR